MSKHHNYKIKYSKDSRFRVLLGRKEEMITVTLIRKQKNETLLYGRYEHSSVKVHTMQCEQLDNLTLQLETYYNAVIKTKVL